MLKSGTFIRRKYNKLLIAGLLGWIIAIVGTMADSVIAGIYIGESAVSAVALITPLASIIYAFSMPISIGGGALFSTYAGAFETEKSHRAAFQAILTSICIGLLLFIVLICCKTAFLSFYDCSPEIMAMASEYYDAYIWIGLLEPPFWCVYYLVAIDGDEKMILLNDAMMAISNAVLSLILVQSMGVKGLGIGTLGSYIVCALLLIPHFLKKNNSIHLKKGFSLKDMARMLSIGSAATLTSLYVALIDIIMNKVIVVNYGDLYLSAYTVVNTVLNIAGVLLCGSDSAKAFITVGYGENNPYAIRRIMKIVHRSTIIITIVLVVLFELIAPLWSSIYGITTPEVAQAALFGGRIIPLTYIVSAFVYIYISYYPCTGHIILGNILGIAYMLVGPLVLGIPGSDLLGYSGLTLGLALTPVFALVVWVICVAIMKRIKDIPLLLEPTDEDGIFYDISLTSDSITEVCGDVKKNLEEHKVDPALSNQIQLMVEETLMRVIDYNRNDKRSKSIIAEITLLVSNSRVRLITRDTGKVFDITEVDGNISDFRCYVLSQMMQNTDEKSYATSISFNRNMFIWER